MARRAAYLSDGSIVAIPAELTSRCVATRSRVVGIMLPGWKGPTVPGYRAARAETMKLACVWLTSSPRSRSPPEHRSRRKLAKKLLRTVGEDQVLIRLPRIFSRLLHRLVCPSSSEAPTTLADEVTASTIRSE